jgi:general secretion pathway protein G
MNKSNAFTIIELIFVIVILGILSAVALPKFTQTKELADVAKGRADVASIRSAILTDRQAHIIKGESDYISALCDGTGTGKIFDTNGTTDRKLLTYGIISSTQDGKWSKNGSCTSFNFKVDSVNIQFDYDNATGSFTCDRTDVDTGTTCKKMVD